MYSKGIESLNPLAPLHNPAHVQGIRACQDVFGTEVPQVAVFDTAFHSTMPPKAYTFAIPYEYYEKYAVRRYGFHGTSHKYVSHRCAEIMGKPIEKLKLITCHLGNGSSITAVQAGGFWIPRWVTSVGWFYDGYTFRYTGSFCCNIYYGKRKLNS